MRVLLLFGTVATGLLAQGAGADEIRSVLAAGNCVDIPRKSQVIGTAVTTYTCHGGYNQDFDYNPASGEISTYSGVRCLSTGGANGNSIVIAACVGNSSAPASQRWSFTGSAIKNVASGRCMDIAKKNTASGAAIIVWDCHGGLNQQWTHSLASAPQPEPTPIVTTTTTTSTTIPVPVTTTTTMPPVSGATSFRALQWNVADGESPGEITEIVNRRPDVVFLQEVDTLDQIERFRAALQANQGVAWYKTSINRDMNASGPSNVVILSKYPLSNVKSKSLGYEGETICGVYTNARAALGATISVNGKSIALISLRHFYHSSQCPAQEQNRRLKDWVNSSVGYPNVTHIYGGDFNHIAGTPAYDVMPNEAGAKDAWHEAVLDRTATFDESHTYPIDFYTRTKNNRLDYIFYKNAQTVLDVKSAHIQQLNTSNSDHRQVVVDFLVQ